MQVYMCILYLEGTLLDGYTDHTFQGLSSSTPPLLHSPPPPLPLRYGIPLLLPPLRYCIPYSPNPPLLHSSPPLPYPFVTAFPSSSHPSVSAFSSSSLSLRYCIPLFLPSLCFCILLLHPPPSVTAFPYSSPSPPFCIPLLSSPLSSVTSPPLIQHFPPIEAWMGSTILTLLFNRLSVLLPSLRHCIPLLPPSLRHTDARAKQVLKKIHQWRP